jgi:hypothetical protein
MRVAWISGKLSGRPLKTAGDRLSGARTGAHLARGAPAGTTAKPVAERTHRGRLDDVEDGSDHQVWVFFLHRVSRVDHNLFRLRAEDEPPRWSETLRRIPLALRRER